ncbi:MAG: M23 family metallopeptidase [Prevotellaceae bacterium]|jgi:murein DD-endopeptidase MepM/ murein hydrolase activator NlpD|nr:M23 family metallopeptidase [Prevotellaceae bacterium]
MAKNREQTDAQKKSDMLKNKYLVTVYNDTTLEQVSHFRISGLGAIISGAMLMIVVIATITVLIAFTGLREFIPGYPDATTREKIVANALRTDSLEQLLHQWERHLTNINLLLSGQDPPPIDIAQPATATVASGNANSFIPSREDSLLRQEIEEHDIYDPVPAITNPAGKQEALENLFLFRPVQGVVSDKFDVKINHLAVDIVAAPSAPVMSVLDGTVIMANWTAETGYVIQIQHSNDILSVYKHNEKLLKKQGDRVQAGEAIAIVGNSGELTTGPHLHFELWYKGVPVDPLKYISFE